MLMPAIHSVLNHSDNTLGNHQQQDSQTYSELFPEIDNAPSNSEYDFHLYNLIVNAVDYLKNQPEITKDSSKTRSRHNIKHPCGICHKSVKKPAGNILHIFFQMGTAMTITQNSRKTRNFLAGQFPMLFCLFHAVLIKIG